MSQNGTPDAAFRAVMTEDKLFPSLRFSLIFGICVAVAGYAIVKNLQFDEPADHFPTRVQQPPCWGWVIHSSTWTCLLPKNYELFVATSNGPVKLQWSDWTRQPTPRMVITTSNGPVTVNWSTVTHVITAPGVNGEAIERSNSVLYAKRL